MSAQHVLIYHLIYVYHGWAQVPKFWYLDIQYCLQCRLLYKKYGLINNDFLLFPYNFKWSVLMKAFCLSLWFFLCLSMTIALSIYPSNYLSISLFHVLFQLYFRPQTKIDFFSRHFSPRDRQIILEIWRYF